MAEPDPIPVSQSTQKKHTGVGSVVRIPKLLLKTQHLSIGQQIYCGYGITLGIAIDV
ncbi:MAG: hypothetical protein AAGD25_01315 [Cyanobacteria bacterium P01_F01_bin.150]